MTDDTATRCHGGNQPGGPGTRQAGERVRLTALSHGAGCACKLPLSALDELMATLGTGPGSPDGLVPATGDLLVGAAEGDDAAVLRLDEDRALVLTTDFFTPIVDDPRDWGRVAATNALSDVYAMGGRPVIALNLTAWPGEHAAGRACSPTCCAAARKRPRPRAAWSSGATRSTTPSPSTGWPWSGWPTRGS